MFRVFRVLPLFGLFHAFHVPPVSRISRSSGVSRLARTMIRSAAAVAAAAMAVVLTGCGQLQIGAAAIVGTQRISTSTLSDDVANLTAVYQAHPALQSEVEYTPAQMPRLVLTWLVRFRIVDDIARRAGVQVTPAEAQRALAGAITLAERQTGMSVSPAEFAMLIAMPPGMTEQYGRYLATIEHLATLYTGAKNPSSLTAAQQQQFAAQISAAVAAAVRRLKIKINPRFGQLNATQMVVPAPDRLSRPGTSA